LFNKSRVDEKDRVIYSAGREWVCNNIS